MWVLLLLLMGIVLTNCALPDQECPEACECYYVKIYWVTDCSDNYLNEIPKEGLSKNVYILNMNRNQVREIRDFPMHTGLKRLQLAHNHLTTLTRESFSGLTSLMHADFSDNEIRFIDSGAFRDSPGLSELNLARNLLEAVEGPILSSRTLRNLNLSYCRLSRISSLFFADIVSLRNLDLSGNPLLIIEPGTFDPLLFLEALNLSNCKLTTIPKTVFRNLRNLKTLEISENYLNTVNWADTLKNLKYLRHLGLRKSYVTKLPENAFINNKRLRSVALAENSLPDLNVGVTLGHRLRHLKQLDLSNCQLQIPLSNDTFTRATNIRTLILSGNMLSPEDLPRAVTRLKRLRKLHVRNCGLTSLPQNTFKILNALEELDISHNHVNDSDLGEISLLKSLKVLDISYNNLYKIPAETFSEVKKLKHLILSGNQLSDLEPGIFKDLHHLKILEMNDCSLSEPPRGRIFKSGVYEYFEELHISRNPLSLKDSGQIFPYQLLKVKLIDISSCNINGFAKNVFKNTPNLLSLNLSGNALGSFKFTIDFLKELKHIQELDLKNCNLTRLSPKLFLHTPNIFSLKLSGNPWKCGCYIKDLWEYSYKKHIKQVQFVNADTGDLITGREGSLENIFCHNDFTRNSEGKKSLMDQTGHIQSNRSWAKYLLESNCVSTRRKMRRVYGK